MIGRMVKKALSLAFVAAVVVDSFLIAAIVSAHLELRYVRSEYGEPVQSQPHASFVGFDVNGALVELSTRERGTAVWYASKNCPYCQRDEEWVSLATALRARGVRVIVLLPGYAHRFPAEDAKAKGADQVAFISREWLTQFPLSVTPTLLVFDGGQRLLWYKRGMLSPEDSAAALRATDIATR